MGCSMAHQGLGEQSWVPDTMLMLGLCLLCCATLCHMRDVS